MPAHIQEQLGTLTSTDAPDGNHASVPQIRSRPIGSSGCEFRYPGDAPEPQDLDFTAAQIVAAAVRTMYAVPRLAAWLDRVRAMAARTLEPANHGPGRIELTAIGVTPFADIDEFETTLDVSMLGCDLRPVVERVGDPDLFRLEEQLAGRVASHTARHEVLAAATAAGVRGWICGSALRVVDRAGHDPAEILATLDTQREVRLPHPGEEACGMADELFWDDGVVRAYAENRRCSADFRLDGSVLSLPRGLPDTIVASLAGRRFREVVDLDLVPETAIILGAAEAFNRLELRLQVDRTPFGTAP